MERINAQEIKAGITKYLKEQYKKENAEFIKFQLERYSNNIK